MEYEAALFGSFSIKNIGNERLYPRELASGQDIFQRERKREDLDDETWARSSWSNCG